MLEKAGKSKRSICYANMKQQLRCYEADVCDVYEAKHTIPFFRVAKPRFIGEADFIFHTPQVCFICTSVHRRDNKKCPTEVEHFLYSIKSKLSLGELRCTTSALETVLLSVLHTGSESKIVDNCFGRSETAQSKE